MTDELKPVKCGCGGEASVITCAFGNAKMVLCGRCGMRTVQTTEAEAITAWNRAMSGNKKEKLKAFWDGMSAEMKEERTAKVVKHHYDFDPRKDSFFHGSGGTELLCGNCKKKILDGDDYCSHCGARLEWE